MNNLTIRLLIGFSMACLVLLGFWLFGFDLNERNKDTGFAFIMAVTMSAMGAVCPLPEKTNH